MSNYKNESSKYLSELKSQYPTKNEVTAEIVRLNGILNLPKGTELFLSDIHGEYEAFSHVLRNASGVIRGLVDELFVGELDGEERAELACLIYYPTEKLEQIAKRQKAMSKWYSLTIKRLLKICRLACNKYTTKEVRKILKKEAGEFFHIIDELLDEGGADSKSVYYESMIKGSIRTRVAKDIIKGLSSAIKSLVIDHIHILGDIFDRGPRPDLILDELMTERSIDVQWGNHDVLWMGAAAGSEVCIATVLNNCFTYKNIDIIEIGYGISLRPLSIFAEEIYDKSNLSAFMPKGDGNGNLYGRADDTLLAKMHKAISIIQFKLEGEIIARNPSFLMNDRLILGQIDKSKGKITIKGVTYDLLDRDFPTINDDAPYSLTNGEKQVIEYLKVAFMHSERLNRHIKFLFDKGGMYKVYNNNLLFHGGIPLTDDGDLMGLEAAGGLKGKALMDYLEKMVRKGYFSTNQIDRDRGKDFLWFLWCGQDSPLCARKKITSFERLLIADKSAHVEPPNAYYATWNNEKLAIKILEEFGLSSMGSHIINGHIPVKKGDSPIKANGRIIVIDGGFCKTYHDSTGIGGYTLIYNAEGMSLKAHQPFFNKENAIKNNADIISETVISQYKHDKMRIRETDMGTQIREKISDLLILMKEYESGNL